MSTVEAPELTADQVVSEPHNRHGLYAPDSSWPEIDAKLTSQADDRIAQGRAKIREGLELLAGPLGVKLFDQALDKTSNLNQKIDSLAGLVGNLGASIVFGRSSGNNASSDRENCLQFLLNKGLGSNVEQIRDLAINLAKEPNLSVHQRMLVEVIGSNASACANTIAGLNDLLALEAEADLEEEGDDVKGGPEAEEKRGVTRNIREPELEPSH